MADINIFLQVDTNGLLRDFPSGDKWHDRGMEAKYYTFILPPENAYHDPSDTQHLGIQCEVGDHLVFRTVPKVGTTDAVITHRFEDYVNEGQANVNETRWLSAPRFETYVSNGGSIIYNNEAPPPVQHSLPWPNQDWSYWDALTELVEKTYDPVMVLSARQSTTGDNAPVGQHIQFYMAIIIRHLGHNYIYYYDPYIKIYDQGKMPLR